MLGRALRRRGRRSLFVFDKHGILADFYDGFNGYKLLLLGKAETLAARNSKSRYVIFGIGERHIAHLAEVFSVRNIYNVLLSELRK